MAHKMGQQLQLGKPPVAPQSAGAPHKQTPAVAAAIEGSPSAISVNGSGTDTAPKAGATVRDQQQQQQQQQQQVGPAGAEQLSRQASLHKGRFRIVTTS